MTTYEIKWRKFTCHPETCNHAHHHPWWIVQDDYHYYMGFPSKQKALDYKKRWLDESFD